MAEAVRLFEGIDAAVAMNSTSFANRITLSAAELAAAGFANNDEVLVLFWATMSQANTATEQVYRVAYNGSAITSGAASPRIDCWANAANTGRNVGFMGRLDLATLADLTFDNQRQGTSANVHVRKARLGCIRLADFGVENTDWWWNKSTTDVAHTTTYSGTNRASITFDAEAGEEYIVLSYAHFAVDSTSVNLEGRVMLDGSTLVAGDYSEEGSSTTEERTIVCWGVLSGLSAASHTVTFESRDDTATAANNHRESALFIFKTSRWPDLLYNLGSDTAMASGSDVQLATVTGSIADAEDALILANGQMNQDVITGGWIWVRDGGSTIIPPVTDDGAGTTDAVWVACDTTDEVNAFWMGIRALSAGAQDLDLFGNQGDGSTGSRTMLRPRLLVMPFTVDAGVTEVEGAANLTGSGDAAADAETEAEGAAALGGSGDGTADAETEAEGGADLGGAGDLSADAETETEGAAALGGSGAITVEGEAEAEASAALGGVGDLTGDAETEAEAAAEIGGTGALSGDAETEAEGEAALGGAGDLTAAGEAELPAVEGAASLSGSGDLTASGTTEAEGEAALGGEGDLAASGTTEAEGAADLGGTGDAVADAETEAEGAADLGGTGDVSAAPITEVDGVASLSGSGALTASAETEVSAAADLGGEGALEVEAETEAEGAAAIGGEGDLEAGAEVEAEGAAAIGGEGDLAAEGETEAEGAADLGGTGDLTAEGQIPGLAIGEAVLSGTGDLAASGTTEAEGAADVSGSGEVAGDAETEAEGAAVLTGSGNLTASGVTVPVSEGAGALTGAGDLTADGEAEAEASGALGGAGALSGDAEAEAEGAAVLEGEGALTAGTQGVVDGAAHLVGSGSLSASGFQVGEVIVQPKAELLEVLENAGVVIDAVTHEHVTAAPGVHSEHGVTYRPTLIVKGGP